MSHRIALSVIALLALLVALPAMADGSEASIVDILVTSAVAEEAEFTSLLAALSAADPDILAAIADRTRGWTLFAPTDAAFAALAEELGEATFSEILTERGTPRLNQILRQHILVDDNAVRYATLIEVLEDELTHGRESATLRAPLMNKYVNFLTLSGTMGEDGLDLSAGIQINETAGLVPGMVDLTARNGVIHAIDAVIMPESSNNVAGAIAREAKAEWPQFTTLLAAVQAADPALLDLMTDPDQRLTVFAPTDEAFAAVENLGDILADTALLTKVLKHHIVLGTVYSSQFHHDLALDRADAQATAATLARSADFYTIDNANILLDMLDIPASNGIIHAIDAVLIPSD